PRVSCTRSAVGRSASCRWPWDFHSPLPLAVFTVLFTPSIENTIFIGFVPALLSICSEWFVIRRELQCLPALLGLQDSLDCPVDLSVHSLFVADHSFHVIFR